MEVCVENVESVLNAYKGGAKRIELCSLLTVGGLTPTPGFFKTVRKLTPLDVFVMVRPHPQEDYNYSQHDLEIMIEDIKIFKDLGADGFVFGCLNNDREIDIYACQKLLAAANPLPCTFHRAFDVVKNPEEALKVIIDLGFRRILTSGQKDNALLGKFLIKKLISNAKSLGSNIIIMPGGGVTESNLAEILETTNAEEFHGSAKKKLSKSEETLSKQYTITTDELIVKQMVHIGNSFHII